jgi:hypothetical protein
MHKYFYSREQKALAALRAADSKKSEDRISRIIITRPASGRGKTSRELGRDGGLKGARRFAGGGEEEADLASRKMIREKVAQGHGGDDGFWWMRSL